MGLECGHRGRRPALDVLPDEFRRQIDVNVMGPVIVTQAFGPLRGVDRSLRGPPGRIVMISSAARQSGSPLNAPYALPKHALKAFSESLRRELMMFGIDVIIIGPGPIKTAIWEKPSS